jgi:hypothetical protein
METSIASLVFANYYIQYMYTIQLSKHNVCNVYNYSGIVYTSNVIATCMQCIIRFYIICYVVNSAIK